MGRIIKQFSTTFGIDEWEQLYTPLALPFKRWSMKRINFSPLAQLLSIAFLFATLVVGICRMRKIKVQRKVFDALAGRDGKSYGPTINHLMKIDAASTISALLMALEGPQEELQARAARALSLLPLVESPELVTPLASHLQNNPSKSVRLSCAIAFALGAFNSPQVRDAYILALDDPEEFIATIARIQLGDIGGSKSVDALFNTLSNPSWRLRLESCKALIGLQVADERVVSVLQQMTQQPEALAYDAEIEKSERWDQEFLHKMSEEPVILTKEEWASWGQQQKGKSWGKLETILEQAQQIAMLNVNMN